MTFLNRIIFSIAIASYSSDSNQNNPGMDSVSLISPQCIRVFKGT